MRKIILSLLVCFCILFTFLGVIGCADNSDKEIELLDYKVVYRVGDSIDVYDIFKWKDGQNLSFYYTIDDGEERQVEGSTIYLNEEGLYTLRASLSKKVEKTHEIKVTQKIPRLILQEDQIEIAYESTLSMSAIINKSSPIIQSDAEHKEYVTKVIIYRQDKTEPQEIAIKEGVATSDGFFDGKRFSFIYECEYLFTIVSETTGGKVEADLRVKAVEDYSRLKDLEEDGYEMSFDRNTYEGQWTAVNGAEKYRIKFGLQRVETTETSIDLKPYLTNDFYHFDFVVMPLDEDGEKMGKLIAYDVVKAPSSVKDMILGNGVISVDNETATVTLKGEEARGAGYRGEIGKSLDNSYIAFVDKDNGKYGVGYAVEFTFKGNNLPQVCLFADKLNGNITEFGGSGYLLMNGLYTKNKEAQSDSTTNVVGENAFVLLGPNRIDSTHRNYITISEHDKKNVISEKTLFSQKALRETGNDTEYRYRVRSYDADGYLAIEAVLFDNNTDEILAGPVSRVTKTKTADVEPGYIIAFATVKGDNNNTTFSCDMPYYYTQYIPDGVKASGGATFNKKDGSVILPTSYFDGKTNKDLTQEYIAWEGNYGIGTYIDFEFTGNNMPQVMFFADTIDGYICADWSDGNTGLTRKGVLATNTPRHGTADNAYHRSDRPIVVWGPNRYNTISNITGEFVNYTYEVSLATLWIKPEADGQALASLSQVELAKNHNTNYKFTIGTYTDNNGKLAFEFKLYDMDAQTEVCSLAKSTKIDVTEIVAGNVIAYAGMKGSGETTRFKFSAPYQSEPEIEEEVFQKSGSAVINQDGSVTLTTYATGLTSTTGHAFQYIGWKGEYGVGTYLDFEFSGNNMPQVMFFADSIDGYMVAGKTGADTTGMRKGVLIMSGVCDERANRMYVMGPNRVRTDFASGSYTEFAFSDGAPNTAKLTLYGATTSSYTGPVYPLLTQKGLKENGEDKNYKYTIGTYEAENGKLGIHIILTYADGTVIYNIKEATTLNVSDLTAGNIVVYPPIKGNGTSTFKFSDPYQNEPEIEEVFQKSGSAVINQDGSVTLTTYTTGLTSTIGHVFQYVGWSGEYGIGTYLDFEFSGNNMPQVMFFADSIDGYMCAGKSGTDTSGMRKGVIVMSGTSSERLNRMYVIGPNRVRTDQTAGDKTTTYAFSDGAPLHAKLSLYGETTTSYTGTTYPLLTQKGLTEAGEDKSYKYTIGTYEAEGGKLGIHIILTYADGTAIYNIKEATTLNVSDLTAGNIVVYPPIKGNGTSTFKFSDPYQNEPEIEEVFQKSGSAVINQDGSVTLTTYTTGLTSTIGHAFQYIGWKGEYGVGTYLDFEFSGNNMPQVMFFADSIDGYMCAGKSGTDTSGMRKGVIVMSGTSSERLNRMYVIGPNRVRTDQTAGDKTTTYAFSDGAPLHAKLTLYGETTNSYTGTTYPLLTQKGLTEAGEDKSYKYTIGTYETENGKLGIHIILTYADGTAIYNIKEATTLNVSDLTAGNVVIYPPIKGDGTSTFKFSEPYVFSAR